MLVSSVCLHALSLLTIAHASVILPPTGSSLTIPLQRRASAGKNITLDGYAAIAQRLRVKYNRSPRSLDRRQSSAVPVGDENPDVIYFGQINIGTPAQTLNVTLDTGSSDIWVVSTQCFQGCSLASGVFDPLSSNTFRDALQPVSLVYGSGTVLGGVASDTVSMGGFSEHSQTIVVADQVSNGVVDPIISGFIGLGFQLIAVTGETPFVQRLAGSGSLSQPLMSFYLERHINDLSLTTESTGGIFTLGSTNSSLFTGAIDFVPIPATVTPGFWLLPVSRVTVGGASITLGSSSQVAAIDTGTTLIGGPSAAIASLYSMIPGARAGTGSSAGIYTIPCNTKASISMSFGGNEAWPINPVDFNRPSTSPTVCIGAFFDLSVIFNAPSTSVNQSLSPDWVVGDAFLKNVYSVFRFNPPSVGFAQLSSLVAGVGSPAGSSPGTGSSPAGAGSPPAGSPPAVSPPAGSPPSTPSPIGVNSGGSSARGALNYAVSFALVFGLASTASALGIV